MKINYRFQEHQIFSDTFFIAPTVTSRGKNNRGCVRCVRTKKIHNMLTVRNFEIIQDLMSFCLVVLTCNYLQLFP